MGTSRNQYMRGMLGQVLDSYRTLKESSDVPGDIESVRREMLRINGLLKVMTGKIDQYERDARAGGGAAGLAGLRRLGSRFRHYLDDYYFEKEMDAISELYSGDVDRIKNVRLKVIEALEDRKMISEIEDVMGEL